MVCRYCTGTIGSAPLFDMADGTLAPEISTDFGGFGVRVYPDGPMGPHIEIDGMWADGLTGFGAAFPINHCPMCGRDLRGERHG